MRRLRLDSAPPPVVLEGDARVEALVAAKGAPVNAADYVEQINELWKQAKDSFLNIGKLLIQAKDTLPHGEYTIAVEANLPFSARTAYQLREAARWAVDMERTQTISLDRLPGSYSTIYLLSTLDHDTLAAAATAGLVRPELRRAELIAWRKNRIKAPLDQRAVLEAKREQLQRERDRLDAELQRIDAALAEQ